MKRVKNINQGKEKDLSFLDGKCAQKVRSRTLKRSIFLFFLFGALMVFSIADLKAQVVSPFQGGHYTTGLKNIRDMANPPSGLFVLWYNSSFSSNTYVDRNGDKFKSIKLDQFHPKLPNINVDIDLNGFTTIPAIFWASEFKILGGANFMAGISPSYMSVDASLITERNGIVIDTVYTNISKSKVSGFSDTFFAPVGLSWDKEKIDFTFLYGFYAPTGKYETGSSDGLGLGFWTHQFQGFGYFYPTADKSTAILLGLTYEANSKIKDAEVTPGNRFSLEWGLSQYLSERLEVGVMGGHNWQVSDDKGEQVYWDPTFHDKKNTIAFNAGYWLWSNRLMANLKYTTDYGARQRFEMNSWLLNFVFVTNAFTGKSSK
ncbi:SphA family protein [Algoriphagus halophilus]|uniref:Uncharacterized conserved protein n=1 Tax=Algoriphagus halophilus TaxID=226505 RepID=A0A1N6G4R8_9BACT|nr:transporter [Algoriphagus halophilus]SIO02451.1 Uncharacterized conserved protein [Algoriphagus halophilus]